MSSILETCSENKEEYIISMLKEVRDRQDLLQKSDALILARIAELNDKVDILIAERNEVRRFHVESDGAKKFRERSGF